MGDGCRKGFDSSGCIEGSKIIVLQYPVFVLLILLVLYNSFRSLLVSLGLSHLGVLYALFHRYSVGVVCEESLGFGQG